MEEMLNKIDVQKLIELAMPIAGKAVYALAVFIIGWQLIKLINKLIKKFFDKKDYDEGLETFIASLISMTLKVLLLVSVISMLGVQMTSFIALLGGAGVAVGMALSGTLQNFAGGVMILLFKPFKVGDFIEAQGYAGTVKEIQIFNTILLTADNKTIIIPNAPLSNSSLINYSAQSTRRVDMTFGIAYDDDIDLAKDVLKKLVSTEERILKEPATQVVVGELADSSVNLFVRAWVNSADYWGVFFDFTEKAKKEFDKAGLSIPFPQQDVYMHHINESN